MTLRQQALRYGRRRATRGVTRLVPWIGTALALVTVGAAIRRKGVIRGTADTALNALPVVGALKALAETVRGRDLLPDRT